jgi:hypothetical protein
MKYKENPLACQISSLPSGKKSCGKGPFGIAFAHGQRPRPQNTVKSMHINNLLLLGALPW